MIKKIQVNFVNWTRWLRSVLSWLVGKWKHWIRMCCCITFRSKIIFENSLLKFLYLAVSEMAVDCFRQSRNFDHKNNCWFAHLLQVDEIGVQKWNSHLMESFHDQLKKICLSKNKKISKWLWKDTKARTKSSPTVWEV